MTCVPTTKSNSIAKLLAPLAAVMLLSVPQAGAALIDEGNGLIYSTDQNLYWTQDANLFYTQASTYSGGSAAFVQAVINSVEGVVYDTANFYDSGTYHLSASDFTTTMTYQYGVAGATNWWGAQAWVGYLNSINYDGYHDWRLPVSDTCTDINCTNSELGHLYYSELGNTSDSAVVNTGPFQNLRNTVYWSGTEYTPYTNSAWYFNFNPEIHPGIQYYGSKGNFQYIAWAVRPGAPVPVPVPGAIWLMGSALMGLGAMVCRAKAAT